MASSLGAVSTWHLMPVNCLGIMPILQLRGLRLGTGAGLPWIPCCIGNLPVELEEAKHDDDYDDNPQTKIPTPPLPPPH